MAQLKNTEKLFDLEIGDSITVGNNRTIARVKYDKAFGFKCSLHGHGVAFIGIEGPHGECARVTLNDCGYPTVTTAAAIRDFASAFGLSLSVSRAGGQWSIRFKNLAGIDQKRKAEFGDVMGPYACGRYV